MDETVAEGAGPVDQGRENDSEVQLEQAGTVGPSGQLVPPASLPPAPATLPVVS